MSKINDEGDALFNDLVNRYNKLVYKICVDVLEDKEEALDLSQETYLSVYTHIKDIWCLEEYEQKSYVCKIALNKCRDYLRSNKEKNNVINIDDYYDLSSGENVEDKVELEEEKRKLHSVISNLKSPYRELLDMYYIKELSLDEIEIKLNTKKSVIKTQISRAKKELKKKLKERRMS